MAELPDDHAERRAELQRLIKAREGKPGYGPNVKHAKQMLAEMDAPKGKG